MTAALGLMWDEGYSAVTIDEICAKADVKKGSFYYFFKSKADLAVAALEKLWTDDWKPRLDREFSPSVSPLDRLTNYLDSLYERHAERFQKFGKVLGCPIGSVGSEVSTVEADVSAKIREVSGRKQRYYESAIRDAMAEGAIPAGDAKQKAQTVLFQIQGALSEARIMNNPELLRQLPGTVLQMLGAKAVVAAATS
ncbi:MAG TPA: TetR/AcrR family transcriptional regulator [Opitutaceae bacterium]